MNTHNNIVEILKHHAQDLMDEYLFTRMTRLNDSEDEYFQALNGSTFLAQLEARCKAKGVSFQLPSTNCYFRAEHKCDSCGHAMTRIIQPQAGLLCSNNECREFVYAHRGLPKDSSQVMQKTSGMDIHDYVKEFWDRLIGIAQIKDPAKWDEDKGWKKCDIN